MRGQTHRAMESGKEGREQTEATEKRLGGKKELWASLEDDNAEDDLSMGLSSHGAPWFSRLCPAKSLFCALFVPLLFLRWVTADTTDCRNSPRGHISLTHAASRPRAPPVSHSNALTKKQGVGRGWSCDSHRQDKGSAQKWWIRNRTPYCCLFKTFSLQ